MPQLQPTLHQGEDLIKQFGTLDRREMKRMVRLAKDGDVFEDRMPSTEVYRDMWDQWLRLRGEDTAIVFAEEDRMTLDGSSLLASPH